MAQYLPMLSMIVLVLLFASLSFLASRLLGPRRSTAAKEAPYECGIVPETEPAERFPVRFYLVAMAFIVLDVEIVFLYPFTTILRPAGVFGLVAMGVFLLVLLVPFGYLLSTGAVDWGPARELVRQTKALQARSGQRGASVLHAPGTPGRSGLDPAAPERPEPERVVA